MSAVSLLTNLSIVPWKIRWRKSDGPAEEQGTWTKTEQLSCRLRKFVSSGAIHNEREFVLDFGATMHTLSRRDLNAAELEVV